MMNEDKGSAVDDQDFGAEETVEEKRKSSSASRARNRTVMLTPEMTGQVRALLHQEPAEQQKASDALDDFLPPLVDWNSAASSQPSPAPQLPLSDNGQNGLLDTMSGRAGRSNASKMKRDQSEDTLEGSGLAQEPVTYDPMTTVAPPVRRQTPTQNMRAVESPAQSERPRQPTFAPVQTQNMGPPQAASRPSARATGSFQQQNLLAPQGHLQQQQPVAQAQTQAQPGGKPATLNRSVGKSKIVAFLISFDSDKNGEVYEIRSGRWLLTSRPTDHGEYILIEDETISPLHAIIRATKDGKLQVLDQLSEFGTSIFRAKSGEEVEIAGGLESVGHGDTIRFGERRFLVCCVPEVTVSAEEDGEKEK